MLEGGMRSEVEDDNFNVKETNSEDVELRAQTIKFEGFPLSDHAIKLLEMAPMNQLTRDPGL